MVRIFLTSNFKGSAPDIARKIPNQLNALYVTTASEGDTGDLSWRDTNKKTLLDAGFTLTDFTFSGKTIAEINQVFDGVDTLCVEGGNTYYLMQEIQQTRCADAIRNFIKSGKPYIGSSAGSIVLCPTIHWTGKFDAREHAPLLEGTQGLGIVVSCHFS